MVVLSAPALASGQSLVERLCGRCHALADEADSPNAEAPLFREVATRWPPESLAEALAEGIAVGHPDMPRFELTPEEIDGVISYFEHLARAR
jgi:mono/diheme cytochrome c family protein